MDNNIEATDLVRNSKDNGLDYQGYEKVYEDYLRDNELKPVDLRKVSRDYYNDKKIVTGSDTIIDRLLDTGGAGAGSEPKTKGLRATKRTATIDELRNLVREKLTTKGGKPMKEIANRDGIKKFIRPIFQEFFTSEKVLNSLENEEYRELLELVSAFRERFNIDETSQDELRKNLTTFLDYGKSGKGKKLGDTTRFFDALYNTPPRDKEAIRDIVDTYVRDVKGDRRISEKFNEEREIDLLADAVRDFGILETREVIEEQEQAKETEKGVADLSQEEMEELVADRKVIPELSKEEQEAREKEEEKENDEREEEVREQMRREQREREQEQEGGETLDETLETEEQPDEPQGVDLEIEKPREPKREPKTETISNPIGQNLIDQIPPEMISTQFKNKEELKQEIEFLLDKFPQLLIREKDIFEKIDLDDLDQLRRLHKTIIGKLGADRQTQKIAVVIPAEDYIKAEVNKILLDTALKNMRAEDIIQTINMPNRQGETDGLTVGDYVIREGNTSGLQNQGQPIYRYIPTTNQEVEEQQTRTGKIRLNTTKRTRLNVAKKEFRNDPFIFRRPQPIRLKYLG